MEDDLQWKMTNIKLIIDTDIEPVEDDLRWLTTFIGRQTSVKDDLQWKTTFGGRNPSVKDDLWWKMTFNGSRPSVEDDLRWKAFIACCLVRFAAFFILQSVQRFKLRASAAGTTGLILLFNCTGCMLHYFYIYFDASKATQQLLKLILFLVLTNIGAAESRDVFKFKCFDQRGWGMTT